MTSGSGRRDGLDEDAQIADWRRILDHHRPGPSGWCICGARRCTMRYEAQIMALGAGIDLGVTRSGDVQ